MGKPSFASLLELGAHTSKLADELQTLQAELHDACWTLLSTALVEGYLRPRARTPGWKWVDDGGINLPKWEMTKEAAVLLGWGFNDSDFSWRNGAYAFRISFYKDEAKESLLQGIIFPWRYDPTGDDLHQVPDVFDLTPFLRQEDR